MKKQWDFWLILGLLLVVISLIFSMNARMATKDDLARVEADITDLKADMREIRGLLMNHIINGHKGHTHKKSANLGTNK